MKDPNGMIMRMHHALYVTFILLQATIGAQAKPGFSGTWTLINPGDSAASAAHILTVQQTFTRESREAPRSIRRSSRLRWSVTSPRASNRTSTRVGMFNLVYTVLLRRRPQCSGR
jgi:hypothetical protein